MAPPRPEVEEVGSTKLALCVAPAEADVNDVQPWPVRDAMGQPQLAAVRLLLVRRIGEEHAALEKSLRELYDEWAKVSEAEKE